MSESQGGAGRREVAWRLFASEFDDADFSYSQSDEERAPNYVVTPTGARVNRLYVVGVLTEIETVSEDYLRARVVDPTGPFVIYAGQYQPDALAFLERADPPTFVAVTGKARTYQPEDSDQVFTSIRPETISEVDGETRDRWVVQTAEQTVDRVTRMAEAKQTGLVGDDLQSALTAHGVEEGLAAGIPLALDHYGTTGDYLAAVREMALDAARVVAGNIDEAETLDVVPGGGTDGTVDDLVERPIDVDSLGIGAESSTDEAAEAETVSAESEAAVADAGGGNGSAIGTAESSSQTADDAGSTATTETPDESATNQNVTKDATTGADAQDSGAAAETVAESPDEPGDSRDSDSDAAGDDDTAVTSETAAALDGDSTDSSAVGSGAVEDPTGPETTGSDSETASTESTTDDEDLEDFDADFDLDDDERQELEEEFGTEFQSGSEVSEPGEAGIDTPAPDATAAEADDAADVTTDEAVDENTDATGAEPATEIGTIEDTEPPGSEDVDDDVDLEDAVMDAMADLDEGDGAARDDVIAAVVDRTGAGTEAAEDAIQDALMGGRCYEPDDETLKPI